MNTVADKVVALDPGHGGSDPGAVGNGLEEKRVTLKITTRIAAALERDYIVRVELTRKDDRYVSLEDRAAFANDLNASAFASIHINSYRQASARGFETYRHTGAEAGSPAARLQAFVHSGVMDAIRPLGVVDRGTKTANFAVLRLTRMPAILTENLFITNVSDANLLKDDAFVTRLAEAHAVGVARGLALPPRPTEDIHRVTVDGVRVGAFRDDERVGRVVVDAIRRGGKRIVVEEVEP